jgi:hypothetical protein
MILPPKGRTPPTDNISHWRFPVAPGVMLRAKGHQELVDVIFDYRLRNNLPIGDIVRDISTWYCAQYPKFCTAEASDTDPTALRTNNEPMLNRVARWASVQAHRMPRGGFPLVTPAVAESRAKVCVACPRQNAGWKGGCGGCGATTLAIIQQLKSLKKTTQDGSLGACGVTGWPNLVAVWLAPESLEITDAERAALPDACWRKPLP